MIRILYPSHANMSVLSTMHGINFKWPDFSTLWTQTGLNLQANLESWGGEGLQKHQNECWIGCQDKK